MPTKNSDKFSWKSWNDIDETQGIYVIYLNPKCTIKKHAFFGLTTAGKKENLKLSVTQDHLASLSEKWGKIPLYVGRSTNIQKRLRHHLQLTKTKAIFSDSSSSNKFRNRLEMLFSKKRNFQKLILENITLEYFPEPDPIKRFFLEQDIITLLQPPFNIDIER